MHLKESFSEYFSSLKEPQALKEFRAKANSLLELAPFPSPHLESWRKLSLSTFKLDDFTDPCPPSSIEFALHESAEAMRLSELEPENLKIVLQTLESFLSVYKNEWISLFAASRFTHAYYIKLKNLPSDARIPEVSISCRNGNFILPLLIIEVPLGVKSGFLERWKSESNQSFLFMNGISLLTVGAGADFRYSSIENLGDSTFRFRTTHSYQGKDTKFHASIATWGGYRGKAFYDSEVAGKGAWTRYAGLAPLRNREFHDTEIRILHEESHAHSSILYRTAIKGKAHNVFTGNLRIPANCKDVGAVQINNNLLLDRSARAESIPKLEVFADSVKCEHGATVGEIDEEQLFYLASRGISKEEARKMIVEGFLAEVIREFPSESIREELADVINSRMLGDS
ncbi:FeS assembly protein SufD [Leptospira fainei serovar Hurstbridge str. BUT 6]|uniref:FeS assembly protein SufD n=2 Tax=Leptospira fainei TaxID=48782 RepID=S3VBJ2_9LEPT|nr:FeS assembly protein SufD [Leptospira fainei serovar Hurstbridge str. BUT 6]